MNEISKHNELIDQYRASLSRFDFFFLSVILGALALSIQTFDLNSDPRSIYLIIITWTMLLTSFVAGLFRQERLNMYRLVEIKSLEIPSEKQTLDMAKDGKLTLVKNHNQPWSIEEIHDAFTNLLEIEKLTDSYKRLHSKQAQKAYLIKKWSFLYAMFTYALYKITNIIEIKHLVELHILTGVIVVSYIVVRIYKRLLPKVSRTESHSNKIA